MKTTRLPFHFALPLVIGSCASIEHQVPQNVPHALIRFVEPPVAHQNPRTVVLIDGVRARYDQYYRVRPGGHDLVIEQSGITKETGSPVGMGVSSNGPYRKSPDDYGSVDLSRNGSVSTSGIDPFATTGQFVNLSVENRQITRSKHHIEVQTGWRYEHDGLILRKTTKLP